jgi:hypothetical protein
LFGSKHPTFDPMAIQTMADAVDEAWAIMKATGHVSPQNPQEMRLALAKSVIEVAAVGDHNIHALRDAALARVARSHASVIRICPPRSDDRAL